MRILVYPHELVIGGSQINAIDLAAQVASAGHDVLIYGEPGPLVPYIEKLGLRYIASNTSKYRPSLNRIRELYSIARTEKLDLIHAYEWPTCLDAFYGAAFLRKVPLICTVLSMGVEPLVPQNVPLIMGTRKLGDEAITQGQKKVWVLEPPIDAKNDNPEISGTSFRESVGVGNDEIMIALVSRLAVDLKLDALVQAIDAAEILSRRHKIRLVIVGEGPAHESLLSRAARVNESRNRDIIHFAGALLDPRPAYAAADVVLGMGSSSMRAMAMGKPVIVQGERGFCRTFSPQNAAYFFYEGFYGIGDGSIGADEMARQIELLIMNPNERALIGEFGHRTIVEKFSLPRAAKLQMDIYEEVLQDRPTYTTTDVFKSAYLALMQEVRNHDPRRKRERRLRESSLLNAVRLPPMTIAVE